MLTSLSLGFFNHEKKISKWNPLERFASNYPREVAFLESFTPGKYSSTSTTFILDLTFHPFEVWYYGTCSTFHTFPIQRGEGCGIFFFLWLKARYFIFACRPLTLFESSALMQECIKHRPEHLEQKRAMTPWFICQLFFVKCKLSLLLPPADTVTFGWTHWKTLPVSIPALYRLYNPQTRTEMSLFVKSKTFVHPVTCDHRFQNSPTWFLSPTLSPSGIPSCQLAATMQCNAWGNQ